jgi:radical SAM superfamily enzyme YgiQ (UPF0313 family)
MRVFLISLFDEWALGIRSLSAYLKSRGHSVSISLLRSLPEVKNHEVAGDPEGYSGYWGNVTGADIESLLALLKENRPGLVGISFTSNFPGLAYYLAGRIKKDLAVPIVYGGVGPTTNPDLAIEHADFVCRGEGEDALSELVERLEEGKDPSDIANLWVRRPDGIRRNPVRPLIEDLDRLPYCDFDPAGKFYISDGKVAEGVFPEKSHLPGNFPMVTARGCPFTCSYCYNALFQEIYQGSKPVRRRSVDHVMGELGKRMLLGPKPGFIEFHDDVFTLDLKWVKEFGSRYGKEIGLPFFCYTHPSAGNPEMMRLLREAGLSLCVMGVQTGSARVSREVYRRGFFGEKTVAAAKTIMDLGIELVIDIIGNNPLETDEDLWETLDLLLSLQPGFVLHPIPPLNFFRNFPIMEMAEKQGIQLCNLAGTDAFVASETPRSRFWNALYDLTQYSAVGATNIRQLSQDPFLKEHPEPLEGLARALAETSYLPGTRVSWKRMLEGYEARLSRIEGSRVYRFYRRIKGFLKS